MSKIGIHWIWSKWHAIDSAPTSRASNEVAVANLLLNTHSYRDASKFLVNINKTNHRPILASKIVRISHWIPTASIWFVVICVNPRSSLHQRNHLHKINSQPPISPQLWHCRLSDKTHREWEKKVKQTLLLYAVQLCWCCCCVSVRFHRWKVQFTHFVCVHIVAPQYNGVLSLNFLFFLVVRCLVDLRRHSRIKASPRIMAIKDKNFDEQAMTVAPMTIGQILEMLQTMEPQLGYDNEIELICDSTVKHLVEAYVPPHAGELKKFRIDLLKIGDLLESIVKRSDNYEQIILTSLQTLYKLIVSTGEWTLSLLPF